jgi:tol-pal system protein YbgF
MHLIANGWVRAGAVAVACVLLASFTYAQQPPAPRPQAKAAPAPAHGGGDSALQRRIEQLEEQLVDMQAMVGTLESLSKGANTAASAPRGGSGFSAAVGASDAGRLDAIETQIRALAAQLESLQDQVRSLGAGGGAPPPVGGMGRRGSLDVPPPAAGGGFGSVTVAPDPEGDEIDRLLTPQGGSPARVAASPPMSAGEPELPPQQLYEKAYAHLLQKDYDTAEGAFEDFLRRHASHQLAGNAQYWLGETYYVRGQYRAAAAAFLKGYQTYARSPKAPESLLKLAMSLQRLGQKDAACSSFNELSTKYPNPPAHVKSMAQAERQRGGCGGA